MSGSPDEKAFMTASPNLRRDAIRPGFGSRTGDPWNAGALRHLTSEPMAFAEQIWGRGIELSSSAGPLTSRFSIDGIGRLLGDFGLRLPDVRMMRNGEPIPAEIYTETAQLGRSAIEGLVNVDKTLDLVSNGATLILQGARRYCPEVDAFCRRLDIETGQTTQAGFFLTPSFSVGAPLHYDFFDAFICQIEGTKHWDIYPVPEVPPKKAWHPSEVPDDTESEPFTLTPGSCLYFPRGTYHQGRTGQDPSLHLTIRTVQPFTYRSVIDIVIDALLAGTDVDRILPIGYQLKAAEIAAAVVSYLTTLEEDRIQGGVGAALNSIQEVVTSEIRQPFDGHARLVSAVRAPQIQELTPLVPVDGRVTSSSKGLHAGAEVRQMTPYLARAVVAAFDRTSFTPASIQYEDRAEVLKTCRWLMLAGAVKIDAAGEASEHEG